MNEYQSYSLIITTTKNYSKRENQLQTVYLYNPNSFMGRNIWVLLSMGGRDYGPPTDPGWVGGGGGLDPFTPRFQFYASTDHTHRPSFSPTHPNVAQLTICERTRILKQHLAHQ